MYLDNNEKTHATNYTNCYMGFYFKINQIKTPRLRAKGEYKGKK